MAMSWASGLWFLGMMFLSVEGVIEKSEFGTWLAGEQLSYQIKTSVLTLVFQSEPTYAERPYIYSQMLKDV